MTTAASPGAGPSRAGRAGRPGRRGRVAGVTSGAIGAVAAGAVVTVVAVVAVVAALAATGLLASPGRPDRGSPAGAVPPTTVLPATVPPADPQADAAAAPPDTAPDASPPCPPPPPAEGAPPGDLAADLARRLGDPRLAGQDLSLSVRVDGWGEVVRVDAERALLPASNQKLLTAMGALEVLAPDGRFETRVTTTVAPQDGVVAADLVLVAGGDPTLTGQHLADLATQVRHAGVEVVHGDLVIDESRYDGRRAAEGWLDWQRPAYAGALSALVVDRNQYRGDPAFLDDPATAGGERFTEALARAGVEVRGTVRHPHEGELAGAGASVTLAHHASAPFAELVATMLRRSDNMIAEALVREVGVVAAGEGSTAAGLHAAREALAVLCVPLRGIDHDGSGLSRANRRSADEWRALLEAARSRPWWPQLLDALPVAGRTGTLAGRLAGPATAGNVRAKTGSIIPARALSGYATTVGGRQVVFSLLVNGDRPGPAQQALDELLAAVVAHPG